MPYGIQWEHFLNIDRGDNAQTIEDETVWLNSHKNLKMHMPPVSINPFVALHPSAGVAMRVLFDLI